MIRRYEHEKIVELWTPTAIYARWFEVEVAHVRQIAGMEAARLLAEDVGAPSAAEVTYHERETGHDVAAFLRAVDIRIVRELAVHDPKMCAQARSALHYGLTSSDVVDTAQAMGLTLAGQVVYTEYAKLADTMLELVRGLRLRFTIGRTHGQLASRMPAADRWQMLYGMLDRAWNRVDRAGEDLAYGKLSGPVGATGGDKEVRALSALGLHRANATQIVPRDRLAHWAYCMSGLASAAEAVATQVWLLAQQGIEEVRVSPVGSVGSSAMPHKNNPILAENIRGLARLARAAADSLQLGIVQWGEHDLAHSSVERVCVPDLLHLVCTILSRTATLVSGLSWEEPSVPSGYVDTGQRLRDLQATGMSYADAHAQLTASYRDGKIPGTTTEEGQ